MQSAGQMVEGCVEQPGDINGSSYTQECVEDENGNFTTNYDGPGIVEMAKGCSQPRAGYSVTLFGQWTLSGVQRVLRVFVPQISCQ